MAVGTGGQGGIPLPHILEDNLTLFQSAGQIISNTLLIGPTPLRLSDLPTAQCYRLFLDLLREWKEFSGLVEEYSQVTLFMNGD